MVPPSTCFVKSQPPIGSGSTGRVYKGRLCIGSSPLITVAVKKSRVSLHVRRPTLYHEARILTLLDSPNVVGPLLHYFGTEHFEYLILPLLGDSISKLAPPPRPVSIQTVLRMGDQVLSGLEHIHSRGLAHGDIKPGNLCMSTDGLRVCIIDFALARLVTTTTSSKKSHHCIGTLEYCSVNSLEQTPFGQYDDLESLAYILIRLGRSNLPWYNWRHELFGQQYDPEVRDTLVHLSKKRSVPTELAHGLPDSVAGLLTLARNALIGSKPDYNKLRGLFGGQWEASALNWSPTGPELNYPSYTESLAQSDLAPTSLPKDTRDEGFDSDLGSDSRVAFSMDYWDTRQGECDSSLTAPARADDNVSNLPPLDDMKDRLREWPECTHLRV